VRSDAQKRAAFAAGRAQSRQIGMLQIADAAVNHLERIRRRAPAKIGFLDQRNRQAAQRCVPRGAGSEDTAAYDEKIELPTLEVLKCPFHATPFQKLESTTCFSIERFAYHVAKSYSAKVNFVLELSNQRQQIRG
jgi:hypothetical protein